MAVRVVVITDVHFDPAADAVEDRPKKYGDTLMLRAVQRAARFIQPDLVVLLGDLANDAGTHGAACLERLAEIAGRLTCPVIALPGNHDPDAAAFYRAFERPGDFVDVKGVRFVPFLDEPQPGFHARRRPADMARMAGARQGFDGPLVALQHVPVFAPGRGASPYRMTNEAEVMAAMQTHGYTLAVGGHYHPGTPIERWGGTASLAAPGLFKPPFAFLELTLDGSGVQVRHHELRLPEKPRLVDTHVHTQFAYCGENVAVRPNIELAELLGLDALRLTEHTGQLYFEPETFWGGRFMDGGLALAQPEHRRMDAYFAATEAGGCPAAWRGFEVDCDFHGRAVVSTADRAQAAFLNGSMHWLPETRKPNPEPQRAAEDFMAMLEPFAASGIHALAHPFRVFHRAKLAPPDWLQDAVVRVLKKHGVAAEINFHSQTPVLGFVRRCLDADVKLTLGSDAHNLYEVGELQPHLDFLKQIGFDGDLADVLLDSDALAAQGAVPS